MSSKLAVIFGAGALGQELAHVFANAGCEVKMIDETEERLKSAIHKINLALDSEIARWGLTESEKRGILGRISTSTTINDASKADYLIECIPEILDGKRRLFKTLDAVCRPECILVTSSASLMISDIARGTNHPERMIAMHFINPASKIQVVEIARGTCTSDATYENAVRLARMLQKTPITVLESPGFVTARIILPMINQAVKVLEEGISCRTDIDSTLKLGFGLNIGPFALADKIGVDSLLYWMENIYNETSDQAYLPAKLLKRMVREGLKGVKSGKGFYNYDNDGRRIAENPLGTKNNFWNIECRGKGQ